MRGSVAPFRASAGGHHLFASRTHEERRINVPDQADETEWQDQSDQCFGRGNLKVQRKVTSAQPFGRLVRLHREVVRVKGRPCDVKAVAFFVDNAVPGTCGLRSENRYFVSVNGSTVTILLTGSGARRRSALGYLFVDLFNNPLGPRTRNGASFAIWAWMAVKSSAKPTRLVIQVSLLARATFFRSFGNMILRTLTARRR